MTKQTNADPTLTTPVDDMSKDQVELTRKVLREMWDRADKAIDQTRRSTQR